MEQKPSQTAVDVAELRAAHQLIDNEPRILEDPVVLRLLGDACIAAIRSHPERFHMPRLQALRTHVVVRSRFAEDRLAAAVDRGIRQYVILGAGLDTFAYRQPAWAGGLRIFEVDQPASQLEKQARLEKADIPIPANLAYAAIDFESESLLSGLQRAGFDPRQPTFLSWLGVMVYLRQPAIDAVFRFVAALPHSSEIVFTFSQGDSGKAAASGQVSTAERTAAKGEPWLTFTQPDALEDLLRGMGFAEVVFLTPQEIDRRYLLGRRDGLRPPQRTNTASARV